MLTKNGKRQICSMPSLFIVDNTGYGLIQWEEVLLYILDIKLSRIGRTHAQNDPCYYAKTSEENISKDRLWIFNDIWHTRPKTLQWHHRGIMAPHLKHQQLNCLFGMTTTETSKLHIIGPLCREFFWQRASNAESVYISWRHEIMHAVQR